MTITISNNALPAHARHQHEEDIIPAPAGGCPAPSASAPAAALDAPSAEANGNGHAKVTISHATGSETNPFVTITIAEPAVAAHRRHQHEEDIIPAPEAGCPAAAPAAALTVPGTTRETPGLAIVPAAPAPAAAAPAAPAAGETPAASDDRVAVLGETVAGEPAAGGGDDDNPAVAGDVERRESGADSGANAKANAGSSLPFTGLDLALVVALGLGALLAGVALRRSLNAHRPTA